VDNDRLTVLEVDVTGMLRLWVLHLVTKDLKADGT